MEHIVIIGNGISGITAARHIRKFSKKKISIISSESDYFFSRTALMYVFMGHMQFKHTQPYENWFWKKNDLNLINAHVESIDTDKKQLVLNNGNPFSYDTLIIATGSSPNKFGWPGQDLNGVQGLYSKQDLEALEKSAVHCKKAVVVGGGLIGIELVEMLISRNIPVTFLVREDSFWNGVLPKQESALINRHILKHHIDLRLSTGLQEIIADDSGNATAVITSKGERINCSIVGLTAGVHPNIDFIKSSKIATNRGVLVNRFLETNIKNIYAIGDCAEQSTAIGERRPVEAVWYTGRMMGETIAQTICNTSTEYKPGHWFNSAKFLDIEYQTYGWVWAEKKEHENRFYWESSQGDKCMHFSFDQNSHKLIGLNSFGIRIRHEKMDTWLTANWTIQQVLANLNQLIFDPELYKAHQQDIVNAYNTEFNENIKLEKKRWKAIFSK